MNTININLTLDEIQIIIDSLEFTNTEFNDSSIQHTTDENKICNYLKNIIKVNG